MRQYDYVFDIDNKKIGVGRAKCSNDPNMIISEQDYIDYGNTYGLEIPVTENEEPTKVAIVQEEKDFEDWNKGKKVENKFITIPGKTSSSWSNHNSGEKSFVSKILSVLGGIALMIFAAVVVLFLKELCCIIRYKMIGGPKADEAKLIKYQFDNERSGINNEL